jgi:serine O-acetyltransferase
VNYIRKYIDLLQSDIIVYLSLKNDIKIYHWFYLLHPRIIPVFILRTSNLCYQIKILHPLSYLLTWLNIVIFGFECTPKCKIGPGLRIPHSVGIVIGAYEIGCYNTIFQGVTLGASVFQNKFIKDDRPVLLDNITIGSGAKIIGGFTVGSNVTVGANSVVLQAVSDGETVVGIPAKPIKR